MKNQNHLKAWIILGVYLIATCSFLLWGYAVQAPAVKQQEFPFSVTYSYLGETETISGVYVAEYYPDAKYIGDDDISWNGYVKDRDRLEGDYFVVADGDCWAYSINLNFKPGYFMGDPAYAEYVCQPTGQYNSYDSVEEIVTDITDPAELEALDFSIVSWAYPVPIENSFSFGGVCLSSEATMYTAIIAVVALVLSLILIRKEPTVAYSKMDKFSIIFNFAVAIFAFPLILIVSALSEIVADASFWQQILYLTPALTAVGIAASLTLRRLGNKVVGFFIQFAAPAYFAVMILLDSF